MNKAFELWIRQRYGSRYDLTRDVDGFYCREVVKRMFEVWCHCCGLNVV
ncbi:hypothetical protein ABVX93_000952 [Escherichia coli]|uniref:Bacteriophage protein n=1 Tax=Escherichia coli TaxID=562 RepID=A0A6D0K7I5_ECOLX|nr:hypothetical protein [Escherichia coli]EEX2150080.1 hypothetical protein [Escherichia coli]EEX8903717.1 hypothetical protein [Escherichia coli]EFH0410564.1 hypothetical protein [Escherichia coli]EFL8634656.1 hypothetical protein [Escherichia coli]EFN7977187.1 hypothetical protein [Escherichia coli]